jgi:Fe-S-cluster containining protein
VAKTKKKDKAGKKAKIRCHQCSGLCCRYFALPIETPEDADDYDDIRWYLSHTQTQVFVEDGDWYLNVLNPCIYLGPDNRCLNYEKRPKICRTYKTDDCELTSGDYGYELHFTSDKQMEEYMKIKFGPKVFERYDAKKHTKAKSRSKRKTR